ncbi:TIGR03618 family F420-dependent PPOX class oxidoreductase [Streptomyces sp. SAS_269]|uniref:TIGR03618 family F420-dependent PPOX class oxidoreductase n=1 Tax=Streptomyces sp. SAS_269 TaxID=3412749 RepID=UPI00403CF44D
MTQGPAPRPLSDEALSDLLGEQQFGTLATVKRSGHPHLTTMLYSWDPEARVARFSTTADRVKVGHLRRNPRAALHVQGGDVWSFAVAEGEAEVSEITTVPGDAVGRELLGMIHLGARTPDGGFAMLGKTFKGMTDAMLAWQTERLRELAVEDGGWGIRVRPELVVEIAYDGLQRSSRYPAGVTLRFARVIRYREDKRPEEADTVEALLAAHPEVRP